jgi:predicted nucleic acid-binding protein
VAEPAVVNASPLIFLAGAGLAELLRLVGAPVQIPNAVVGEIERFSRTDAATLAVKQWDWLVVVDAGLAPAIIERWDLGSGETSVLTWAHAHPGTTAVVDDLAARRCANSLGIPVRGTLGLVLTAKRRGIIPNARPVVEQLRAAGMYLSNSVLNRALKTVGE